MGRKAYERGMKTRRKVLGDEWVDRAERSKTPFNEEFQSLITRYAWDEIWNRPRFSHETRRLLVLAMTAAQGRWEEFQLHVRSALVQRALEPDDIKEVLLQAAIYCGVPTANTGFKEARAVMESFESPGKAAKKAAAAKKGAAPKKAAARRGKARR